MKIKDREYKLIEDLSDSFNKELVEERITDYFNYFDYIVGDYSYNKLRLKGFCKKTNPNFKEINDYDDLKNYIDNKCAYGCKYFVLENLEVINELIREDD